jgi:hypothetical protein
VAGGEAGGPAECADPDAVDWLDVTPRSGTLNPGGSQRLQVRLDSTGQAPGVLTATLCLASNDPSRPLVTVLVDSTGLTAGEHVGNLCVTGNDPDAPLVPVPVTVTVTEPGCDQTVTGEHIGLLTVREGLTCLSYGSELTGPVAVRAGASLFASGTTVVGPVSAGGAAWSRSGTPS